MSVYKEKQKLGELLCKIGLMNEDQVMQALLLQKEQGIKFGDAVVKLGYLTKDDINWALSTQLNIPYIPDLKEKGTFDPQSVAMLPYEFAQKNCVIVLGQTPDAVNIVTADPLNQTVIEYMHGITGKHINVSISDEKEILRMIEVLYKNNNKVDTAEHHGGSNVAKIKTEINSILKDIGNGFDAEVYKNAICISFKDRAKKNVNIQLIYKDAEIGKYFIDIIIDGSIGVLFSDKDIDEKHIDALLKLGRLQGLIITRMTEKLTLETME